MPIGPARNRPKLMAVSSGGGHWVQLLRLAPAFANCEVIYVGVDRSYALQVPQNKFRAVNDATRWNKFGLLRLVLNLAWVMWREKPDVVVSTGAAPGYVALRIGKLTGAKTIWIDSIANVEVLSMSGARIGRYADLWLTQWPHLARPEGPYYAGAVL
jgi:UDP-N-acetylglucosamine:LPS N-acetylglucosamine transferase